MGLFLILLSNFFLLRGKIGLISGYLKPKFLDAGIPLRYVLRVTGFEVLFFMESIEFLKSEIQYPKSAI